MKRNLPVRILTINAGSSTLRFALYEAGEALLLLTRGKIDRIGFGRAQLLIRGATGETVESRGIEIADHRAAANWLLEWLGEQSKSLPIEAVGHRVVHGLTHSAPELLTPTLFAELQQLIQLDPEHMPFAIGLMTAIQERYPELPQIACFDTAFHSGMPRVAKVLPIPFRYQAAGVERYGFHGLSYSYLMEELARLQDPAAVRGRVILAHLGNGASMAAVKEGIGVDTSMGFTPTSGLMMSTRSGDLDPGLVHYLAQTEQMTPAQFQQMVSHASGLLGVSGISSDLRDLLAQESTEPRAAEAVALFCYQARKWIGSFAAALSGVDTLVFAGGIGENAPSIRERICEELGFLGIGIDRQSNLQNAAVISSSTSSVTVRVIRTDEELMIARSVSRLLGLTQKA